MNFHRASNSTLIGRKNWTGEEDEKLIQHVNTYGKGKWKIVAKILGLGKAGSSCSQRYNNYLRPDLVRGPFTEEEKLKILTLHPQLGNKWARIARHLTGRTDNAVKNFWYKHFAKETRLTEKKKAAAVVLPPTRGGVITVPESDHYDVFPPQDGGFTFPESDHGAYYQQMGNHPSPPVTFPESGGVHGRGVYPSQPPFPIPDGGVGGIAFPKSGLSYDHQLGVYPSQSQPPIFPIPESGPVDVSYGGGVHRVYPSPPRFSLSDGGITFPETGLSFDLHGGGTDGVYPSQPPSISSISSFGDVCYDHQLGNDGGTFGNPIIGREAYWSFHDSPSLGPK